MKTGPKRTFLANQAFVTTALSYKNARPRPDGGYSLVNLSTASGKGYGSAGQSAASKAFPIFDFRFRSSDTYAQCMLSMV